MRVVECDVPRGSVLSRDLSAAADFHDSYGTPLARPELAIFDIFFAVFGHGAPSRAVIHWRDTVRPSATGIWP